MADDLLGGVLGGEEERPEAEAPRVLAGAEAFAAATAAIESRQDPGVARKTEVFLERQAQLLEIQAEHLRDEHALRLAQLAHQRSLLHGQRIGQAIRITFQILIALVALVIGLGIAVMLHDAFTSHSVVIDAFDAPAALAPRGVTGTVVASDVLDELTRLQDATHTVVTDLKYSLSNAWSNQVKVDVPDTGISLGEVSRLLKARFGHDLHIGGELVETASGGLALTVRGDRVVPKTFTGGADDYHQIVVGAAQYLYAEFNPYLWAIYLAQFDRCPEAISFIESAYASVDNPQRALLLDAWAFCRMQMDSSAASLRAALQQVREAIELRPDFWQPYAAEETILGRLGEEEEAWHVAERSAGRQSSGFSAVFFDELTWDLPALEGPSGRPPSFQAAWVEVQLHDPAAAALALQSLPASDQSVAASAEGHYVRGLWAEEIGDVSQAATEMEAYGAALASPSVALQIALNAVSPTRCWIAPIEEAAGHPDKADAAIASGSHYVDCQRFRGDILDHRGDWAGAQQAYAQSVALAPDLPAGYYSWGVALARHGDLAGAIAKLEAANQRGPHWADPLKAWGDVLAKQGHWKDALAKYDEALKYAPNWAALRQARAAAAARTST